MPSKDQESGNAADDALELNKETLQDLDLEPGDAQNVKGGMGSYSSIVAKTQNMTSISEVSCAVCGVSAIGSVRAP